MTRTAAIGVVASVVIGMVRAGSCGTPEDSASVNADEALATILAAEPYCKSWAKSVGAEVRRMADEGALEAPAFVDGELVRMGEAERRAAFHSRLERTAVLSSSDLQLPFETDSEPVVGPGLTLGSVVRDSIQFIRDPPGQR